MLRSRGRLGLAFSFAAFVVSACSAQELPVQQPASSRPAAPVHAARATPKKAKTVSAVPETPPPPPTLEQQPPVAPDVTYRNGQLTIDARNATLSQVLTSVQAQTGASIDVPAGAASERVVANLGPGRPKDVLATLLNGSKFNYVILGDAKNPSGVQKVILLARSAVPPAAKNVMSAPPPPAEAEDSASEPEPEPEPTQPVPGQAADGDMQPQPGADNAPPGVRTPEQMLQELQRMQQQQQTLQQQLNPSNQGSPFPNQQLGPRPQPE